MRISAGRRRFAFCEGRVKLRLQRGNARVLMRLRNRDVVARRPDANDDLAHVVVIGHEAECLGGLLELEHAADHGVHVVLGDEGVDRFEVGARTIRPAPEECACYSIAGSYPLARQQEAGKVRLAPGLPRLWPAIFCIKCSYNSGRRLSIRQCGFR